ncbi:hypothetical protein SEA_C3PO_65 [Corynebacterium phage C3PO]|uniref:Uncharacterized protein n=2 Tax=Corynebacterium virus C3PO TaxID=2560393 RepID=A0A3G3LW94_9CAUD|nr:hypothetical protein FDJ10_gp78 [Corynebacterium phage C3PO]ATW58465.1 hypothetical protein SEA_C3PO_65 [Corynebacterium phage C3PO]AYQ98361.1 hypothetical protein CRUELLA_65 [Corynebacterium phage Cruella]
MNLNGTFAVIEDGVEIGTFDTYAQAVDFLSVHAIKDRKYQVVKPCSSWIKKLFLCTLG